MKMDIRVFLALAVLLVVSSAPVRAQEETLEELRGRLPESTIFYFSWDQFQDFDSIRAENPFLRLLDTEEMKLNWAMVKDYFKRVEEAEKAYRERQKEAEAKENGEENEDSDFEDKETDESPTIDLKWEDITQLARTPGLFAMITPPRLEEVAGEGEDSEEAEEPDIDPVMLFLYDTSGQEELIKELSARLNKPDNTYETYEYNGLKVTETFDKEGDLKSVETRIGQWAAGASNKEAGEAWFRALQAAPERSLKDVEAYNRAGAYRRETSQLELFLNVNAFTVLVEREIEEDKKKKAVLAEGEEQAPSQPDIPAEQMTEAFGLKDWDFVLFGLAFEPERVQYNLSGIQRPDSVDTPDFIAPSVTSFPSLALAPEDAIGYSVTQMNLGALWGYLERALTLVLPPQQKRLVYGMQGMIEGLLGIRIQELAETWGPEYAQTHYLASEGEEQAVKSLVSIQIQNKELMLTVVRNILPMVAGKLTVTESESELATIFEVAQAAAPGAEPSDTDYVAALSDDWLLVGPSRAVVDSALARAGSGPSLGDTAAVREVRSRLPAELSTFSYMDFDRWLESGELEKVINQYGEQIAEQFRQRVKARRRTEEIGKQQEEEKAPTESPEGEEEQEPSPETDAEESQSEEAPIVEIVTEDILKVEFPLLKIPPGFLAWLYSGTTRDAHGLHHIGVIE